MWVLGLDPSKAYGSSILGNRIGRLIDMRTGPDINKGRADVAAGRVRDFDIAKIVERGRKLLAKH